MKKILILALSFVFAWCLAACGQSSDTGSATSPSVAGDAAMPSAAGDDNTAQIGMEADDAAVLEISFTFTPSNTFGSNQYAVWIEDADGKLVKTLFVTDFTASGGYERREQALPIWVAAANPAAMESSLVDAISGATPSQAGTQAFTWDATDDTGAEMPDGTYTIMLEGTQYSTDSMVLFTGQFELGSTEGGDIIIDTSLTGSNPEKNNGMITDVTARYIA